MLTQTALTAFELEHDAAQLFGKLLFVYARLDVNLALHLAYLETSRDFDASIVLLETKTFKEKLDLLLYWIDKQYNDPDSFANWSVWYMTADTVRIFRNRLVHGRWGILEHVQMVAHVSGLPGSPSETEKRYTLEQLRSEVAETERVAAEFAFLVSGRNPQSK